jgi:hypothetical protein
VNLLPVAQPIPATPPAHGLLASAFEATDLAFEPTIDPETGQRGDRWGQGYTIQPENCIEASTWDPDCGVWPTEGGDNPLDQKTAKSVAGTNELSYDVSPVVIETPFRCESRGFSRVGYAQRARRQLEAATSKAMEFELATGTLKSTNPNLQQAGSTVIGSGSAFTPVDAMLLLGDALSSCGHGGRGMIHAPTMFVDKLLSTDSSNIKEVGSRLQTVNRGDIIVSGSGYPGLGVGGAAPGAGQVYVHATGPVQYRLSPPITYPDTFAEALDRQTNTIEYRSEREVGMNFDPCCHFVILVDVWAASS